MFICLPPKISPEKWEFILQVIPTIFVSNLKAYHHFTFFIGRTEHLNGCINMVIETLPYEPNI